MKRMTACLLIAIVLLVVVSLVLAQTGAFNLPWYRIAGGGGTSTDGAQYTLSGTIGQPEAGTLMEGSSFRLSGGYWGGAETGRPANVLYLPMLRRAE